MKLENLIHVSEIDRYAAVGSGEVAFETGAPRKGDDRDPVFVADACDLGDFKGSFGVGDGDRQGGDVGAGPFGIAVGF